MAGRSTLERLPKALRKEVDRMVRDGATIDEITDALQEQYASDAPSRSAVGRYTQRVRAAAAKLRESRELARVWVQEIGEQPDGDVGRLMVQLLQGLVSEELMRRSEAPGETKLDDLKALAQTIRATAESGRLATQQADLIERRAREKLEREQQDKLAAAGKRGEITPETLQQIRRQLYGLE